MCVYTAVVVLCYISSIAVISLINHINDDHLFILPDTLLHGVHVPASIYNIDVILFGIFWLIS